MDIFSTFDVEPVVKIKKLRLNYEVRFSYDENLINFLKTLPKDHHQTKLDVLNYEGAVIQDWYHLLNESGIYKLIKYLDQINKKYEFDNLKEEEIQILLNKKETKETSIENALKLKGEDIDVEGIDFSFMKKPPYDYQKQAVLFFEQCGGKAILGDAPGVGKAQNINCKICTEDGWKKMKDIQVGDKIFHHSGKSYEVKGVYPQGIQDSYKVIFNDGTNTECNIEHLWVVREKNNKNKKWIVKSLGDIIKNGIYYENKKTSLKWEIPITNPIEYSTKNFIISPYEIGRLIVNKISKENFIPKCYLYGDVSQRIDLLMGLMDKNGNIKNKKTYFQANSKQLLLDVCELVESLGGQAIVEKKYKIKIYINICPFKESTHSNEWNKVKHNLIGRYISKIEKCNPVEQKCIYVNSPDHTYLTDNYIVTHNTLSALTYAVKNNLKTLIICPASLKLNWRNEIKDFTNEKYYIYKYKPSKKSEEILYTKQESLFHIINYESLGSYFELNNFHKCQNYNCKQQWDDKVKKHKRCPHCGRENVVKSRAGGFEKINDKDGVELDPLEYDLIVLDEVHYIKNQKSNRAKLVVKPFKDIKNKLLLTGTAIKNRPYEFFPLLNFIDPNEWKNAHSFAVRYAAAKETKFGWDYNGASNLEELYQRISPYFLRRLKKDVLKYLPDKTYTIIPIELTKEEQREYHKNEKSVLSEMNSEDNDMTHLARIQKLKQYTSKIKLNRSYDFIENFIEGGEKIVIFTQYLEVANDLYNHFKNHAVIFTGKHNMNEKQNAVDEFMNNDNIKIFVGTILAAGVGITLTSASTVLFIDSAWSPSDMIQAEDRCHRANQKADKVQIIRLICNDTIDEDIEMLLKEKEKIIDKLLDGKELNKKINKLDGSIFKDLVQILLEKK